MAAHNIPERFPELLDSLMLGGVGDHFAVIDRSHRMVWAGQPATSEQGAVSKAGAGFCYRYYRGRSAPCSDCYLADVFGAGKIVSNTYSFSGDDGSEHTGQCRIYPIRDGQGDIVSALKIMFDLTGEGSLEAEAIEPMETLTRRELDVLRLMAQGMTNRQISQELSISVHTAKSHVTHIFNKLGASDRTRAVVKAMEQKLI